LKIQADLDTNVADKIETIEMDRHCYAMGKQGPCRDVCIVLSFVCRNRC
jgi:hypothetical protein